MKLFVTFASFLVDLSVIFEFEDSFKKIKFFEFDSFVIRNEEEASLYLDRRDAKVTTPSGDRYYLSWNQRDGFKDT